MRTLPDTIDLIKKKLIGALDFYYSICETIGGKMSVWAWQKRWGNRDKGTGYRKWNHLSNTFLRQLMDLKSLWLVDQVQVNLPTQT